MVFFSIFQHPRGVCVDNKGRIIVVECKVMRVIIFDQMGNVLNKFGCSKHLEFPNGVVVNDRQEIFISDNRAHCVKVFNYEGTYLRQIGGEGKNNCNRPFLCIKIIVLNLSKSLAHFVMLYCRLDKLSNWSRNQWCRGSNYSRQPQQLQFKCIFPRR